MGQRRCGRLLPQGGSAKILADDERFLDVERLFQEDRQFPVARTLRIAGQELAPSRQSRHRLAGGDGLFDLGDATGELPVFLDRVLRLAEGLLELGGSLGGDLAVGEKTGRHRLGLGRQLELIGVDRRFR